MGKKSKNRPSAKTKETKLRKIIAEFSEISRKREEELQEMDRIAKMLVRRDLALSEIKEKREKELQELKDKTKESEETREALINILEDVEETKKNIEKERNKTLTIITNFVDGLLVFDQDKKLSLINSRAENYLKIQGKDLIGQSISELSSLPNIEPLGKLVGGEIKGVFRKEINLGANLVLEVSTTTVLAENEGAVSLIILHDITREKTIERLKTEFVSLVAHQLRTPLSAIKWTLSMLLGEDLGKLTEEQKSFIEKTYKANERMIHLINDLLDVTRIEEGRYLYKLTFSDMEPILQFVISSFKEETDKKGIQLEFKRPKEKTLKIAVDVEKIRLAIQNLLDNAVRYTPCGGKITIALAGKQKEIEISITDTGVGIPADQRGRVFGRFFRGANVLKIDTEGTGLGLFIAKNIIEAHKGKIWFESEEGRGTTFYITFPVEKEFEEFLKEL